MGLLTSFCGKVIVATHVDELPRLEELRQRGEANGLGRPALDRARGVVLPRIEPHATGLASLGGVLDGNHRLRQSVREICGVDFRTRWHGSHFCGRRASAALASEIR